VRKTDGAKPTIPAISQAAVDYKKEKHARGRKEGSTVTTKDEDKTIMAVFKKARPKGHYVDSRIVHNRLPKKLKKKVSRKTVAMI
jgi:hypothetical protein